MKYTITTFLLFVSAMVFAQTNSYTEVVYLKNGSIIKGIIIEQIPNEKLKIETKDGNVFVYEFKDIEKITKELVVVQPAQKTKGYNKTNSTWSENENNFRYFNATELVFSGGVGKSKSNGGSDLENKSQIVGIRTSHGLQTNSLLALAIGTGLLEGKYTEDEGIPVFFDIRYPFLKNKIKISCNFIGGKMLRSDGSYFFNPSLGIKLFLNHRSSFNFNVGTYTRTLSLPSGWNGNYYYYKYVFTDIMVATGFTF